MDRSPSRDKQYCSNCGERITRNANYCHYCGKQFDTQSQRAATPGTQPEQDEPGRQQAPDGNPAPRQRSAGPKEARAVADDRSESGWNVPEWSTKARENPLRTVVVAIGLVIGGFASGLVMSVVALLPISVIPSVPEGVSFFLLLTFQFSGFILFAFGYLRWRGLDRNLIKEYVGLGRPSLREIGLILVTWVGMIVVAGVVAQVVMLAVTELFGSGAADQPAQNPVGETVANNPEIFPAMVLFMFLVVGPSEEFLFRGVVQGRLRERLSAIPAILIASAVFASAHVMALWGQDPVAIAMTVTILFVPSLGFGAIYEYTGNIVIPTLLHGFHNSVVVTVVLLGAQADVEQSVLWVVSTVL